MVTGASLAQLEVDVEQANEQLANASAEQIIQWAADTFGDRLVMTSSFGAQSAIMLHLATRVVPDIPVILIDTGYLFPETYKFIQELTDEFSLNLKVYQSPMSPAWMEAVHGRLWEQGEDGLVKYNRLRKVEPMQRALRELNVGAWLAGLRRGQTDHRANLRAVERQDGIYKVHPIIHWTSRDVHEYLKRHNLRYHPLYDQGYPSIGDSHSTTSIKPGQKERDGRFHGLTQECGMHLPTTPEENQSRESSGL
jgi:phosphoadenosine phosphosulfate reductase